jgi:manganese/zinc/iron transport system permease protein
LDIGKRRRRKRISGVMGIVSAISGYFLADLWNASISASMAVSAGMIFALVFAFTIIKRRLFQKTAESKFIESWQ